MVGQTRLNKSDQHQANKRSNMFDLEKAIADWRRQMLVAGISAPAPPETFSIPPPPCRRSRARRRFVPGCRSQALDRTELFSNACCGLRQCREIHPAHSPKSLSRSCAL